MRINQNRIFPYPVYSEMTNDYKCKGLSAEIDLIYDSETATVVIKPNVEDEKIAGLIEDDVVGLYCHIECSVTKYRELFELEYSDERERYEIEVPLYKLNDTVEILCAIIAKESIEGFTDEQFGPMYEGDEVSFPRYSIIGYSAAEEIIINKRIDINGEVPSIFAINKSESDDTITYDINNDQIVIFLPAEQHRIYFDYVGQSKRIKQMMLIFPVLVDILNTVKSERDDLEDRPWFEVLEAAYKRKGFSGFDDENLVNCSSIQLAQLVLGDLCKDAFCEFDKLSKDKE